jgi:hypothetical protein
MDTSGYKHTLKLYNVYLFSLETIVTKRASILHYNYNAFLVVYFTVISRSFLRATQPPMQ